MTLSAEKPHVDKSDQIVYFVSLQGVEGTKTRRRNKGGAGGASILKIPSNHSFHHLEVP